MTSPDLPETTQDSTAGRADAAAAEVERKGRSAFNAYRVMAFVTGTMLLVLCLSMILKYGFNGGQPVPILGSWVAIVHGWIYVIYIVTVFNLWSTMRWGFGRIIALVAGGVVPALSFIMEGRAKHWFEADMPALRARAAARAR